jgi:hypothetical protein
MRTGYVSKRPVSTGLHGDARTYEADRRAPRTREGVKRETSLEAARDSELVEL